MKKHKQARLEEETRIALRRGSESITSVEELKTGQRPITSLAEAKVYYNAKDGIELLVSPRVTADGGYYQVMGAIDKTESDQIIGKLGGGLAGDIHYFVARVSDSTTFVDKGNLRINGAINLIGRYIENVEYTTVGGSTKTMPVFEAIYITTSQ